MLLIRLLIDSYHTSIAHLDFCRNLLIFVAFETTNTLRRVLCRLADDQNMRKAEHLPNLARVSKGALDSVGRMSTPLTECLSAERLSRPWSFGTSIEALSKVTCRKVKFTDNPRIKLAAK